MISSRAIALEGVGFSPRVFAMVGFSVVSSVSVDAPAWITLALVSQCGIHASVEMQVFCDVLAARLGVADTDAIEQSDVGALACDMARLSWFATLASDCVVSVAAASVRHSVAADDATVSAAGSRTSTAIASSVADIIVTERTRVAS